MSLLNAVQQAAKSGGRFGNLCQAAEAALFARFIRRDLRREA
jgi:hypothetical protein